MSLLLLFGVGGIVPIAAHPYSAVLSVALTGTAVAAVTLLASATLTETT